MIRSGQINMEFAVARLFFDDGNSIAACLNSPNGYGRNIRG